MKALVSSGGGSKGAFGGGVAQARIEDGANYQLYVASSTGSIFQILLASDNIEKAKLGYTTITNEGIWKRNPFKVVKNKNGIIKTKFNTKNILLNQLLSNKLTLTKKFPFIKNEKRPTSLSFGDSSNLRKTLETFISEHDYNKVKEDPNKEVVSCVLNAVTRQKEFKSSNDWGYSDFLDWVWASTSAYPFMAPVVKNGSQYIDGGITEPIPIQEAINRGATDIDVIVLKEENPSFKAENIRNILHGIVLEIDMMHTEIGQDDIQIGKLKAVDEDVKLNFYFTPRKLTNNSLVFDSELMSQWWDEGYESAKQKYCKVYKLVKKRKPKLVFDGMKNFKP